MKSTLTLTRTHPCVLKDITSIQRPCLLLAHSSTHFPLIHCKNERMHAEITLEVKHTSINQLLEINLYAIIVRTNISYSGVLVG